MLLLPNELNQIILEFLDQVTKNELYNSSFSLATLRDLSPINIISVLYQKYLPDLSKNYNFFREVEISDDEKKIFYGVKKLKKFNYGNSIIPKSVDTLILFRMSSYYGCHADNVKKLTFSSDIYAHDHYEIIRSLPPYLEEFTIINILVELSCLPQSLKKLTLNTKNIQITQPQSWFSWINPPLTLQDILPLNLEYLSIEPLIPINKLPHSLKTLIITSCFSSVTTTPYISNLPPNLTKFFIITKRGAILNHFGAVINTLPSSLRILKISSYYSQKLNNLPNLIKLLFSKNSRYDQPLNNLPSTLKLLELPMKYSHDLLKLPKLTHLKMEHGKKTINFPSSLLFLVIYRSDLTIEGSVNKIILPSLLEKLVINAKISNSYVWTHVKNVIITEYSSSYDFKFDYNCMYFKYIWKMYCTPIKFFETSSEYHIHELKIIDGIIKKCSMATLDNSPIIFSEGIIKLTLNTLSSKIILPSTLNTLILNLNRPIVSTQDYNDMELVLNNNLKHLFIDHNYHGIKKIHVPVIPKQLITYHQKLQ